MEYWWSLYLAKWTEFAYLKIQLIKKFDGMQLIVQCNSK